MLCLLILFLIVPAAALGSNPIETIPGYWTFTYYEGLNSPTSLCFGQDGTLYVAGLDSQVMASRDMISCPADTNGDFVADSILRYLPDGTFVDVYSTGHRNPYDLAFVDGVLLATDNSVSGDSSFTCWEAPDEVNRVLVGGDYGFPDCFGMGDCADLSEFCVPPCGQGDCERGAGCAGTTPPFVYLDPHSAPTGICVAEGLPGFAPTDVFVALWGQKEGVPGCSTDFGHKVVWFDATGFDAPIDVAMGPDGALYVADFGTGTIYRIIKITETGVPPQPPLPLKVRAAPNPSRHAVTLHWGAPTHSPAQLTILDVTGKEVAALDGVHPDHTWNLRNASGKRVAQGMYWIQVKVGSQTGSKKILVLN